ncbi:MAG: hypothetical protein KF783_14275 [Sphingomonas sp.]|nr:hypothetical protein [Sphingomonas sp.]
MQVVAAAYFLIDGIADIVAEARHGITAEVATECLIAAALVLGVVMGARHAQSLMREARRADHVSRAARGAMSALIEDQFRAWDLSRAEAEVALFILKGCSIAEIAQMRAAAEGTVRSQLSQVYEKAGVRNQAALLAVFIDPLLDPLLPPN